MKIYLDLLNDIIEHGCDKNDRTGVGTRSVFGRQLRFDLRDSFPLLTTKRIHFKSVVHELLWFLSGETNIHYLKQHGVRIWDAWADADGNLGPIYGKQWRDWDGHDQIMTVLEQIKHNPDSRRLIVSAWNVGELDQMALAPCHVLFQFYVANGELSCQIYQRSADVFLGVPFNIASYSLLLLMMAQQANLRAGELVWTGGDVHLYRNHFAQAYEQLARQPLSLPKVILDKASSIDAYRFEDIHLCHYHHHPGIAAPVAV